MEEMVTLIQLCGAGRNKYTRKPTDIVPPSPSSPSANPFIYIENGNAAIMGGKRIKKKKRKEREKKEKPPILHQ